MCPPVESPTSAMGYHLNAYGASRAGWVNVQPLIPTAARNPNTSPLYCLSRVAKFKKHENSFFNKYLVFSHSIRNLSLKHRSPISNRERIIPPNSAT